MFNNTDGIKQVKAGPNFDKKNNLPFNQTGFTLIEAIVSLVMFGISFAGLFLLFGIAQQTSINTEKKMFLNLIANRIIETIANEGTNTDTAVNPFNIQTHYHGSLNDCTKFSISDSPNYKYQWCNDLQNQVGGFTDYPGEERNVSVVKVGSDLQIGVSLVIDGGADGQNLIQSYFSRRLRKGQL